MDSALLLKEETENQGFSILLLVEINLTLSKAIQNLKININRTRSFKKDFLIDNIFVLFGGTNVSTNDWYSNGY